MSRPQINWKMTTLRYTIVLPSNKVIQEGALETVNDLHRRADINKFLVLEVKGFIKLAGALLEKQANKSRGSLQLCLIKAKGFQSVLSKGHDIWIRIVDADQSLEGKIKSPSNET